MNLLLIIIKSLVASALATLPFALHAAVRAQGNTWKGLRFMSACVFLVCWYSAWLVVMSAMGRGLPQ